MGGGGSTEVHHYHTVYEVPVETKQQLQQQQEQIETFEKEAIERADPKHFQESQQKLIDTFVEQLPKLKLTDIINKKTGENHIGFIGPISAGKTSLINAMFDKNLPVALGHCTDSCEVVHTENTNIVWDVCGQNDDYKFYRPENLSFVKNLDKCAVLFDNDINMIANFLKIIYTINPENLIIVRTKVDQYSHDHARTIAEERILDKQKVKNLLGVDMEIHYVSSHNVKNGKDDKYDWDTLKTTLGL